MIHLYNNHKMIWWWAIPLIILKTILQPKCLKENIPKFERNQPYVINVSIVKEVGCSIFNRKAFQVDPLPVYREVNLYLYNIKGLFIVIDMAITHALNKIKLF